MALWCQTLCVMLHPILLITPFLSVHLPRWYSNLPTAMITPFSPLSCCGRHLIQKTESPCHVCCYSNSTHSQDDQGSMHSYSFDQFILHTHRHINIYIYLRTQTHLQDDIYYFQGHLPVLSTLWSEIQVPVTCTVSTWLQLVGFVPSVVELAVHFSVTGIWSEVVSVWWENGLI